MKTNKKAKKVLNIVSNVVLYMFIIVCILGVIITIMSKKDEDGTATMFGIQMRSVISPSMEECELTDVSKFEIKSIRTKAIVFISVVPEDETAKNEFYKSLKKGDVLTFKYTYITQEVITHRIIDIKENGVGGYIIQLAGDNKNVEDGVLIQTIDTSDEISPNYVIGKVVGQSYAFGLFIWALSTPVGLICIVILPSLIIVIIEVVRIVNIVMADKKKKLAKEREELEELREKLKLLENGAMLNANLQAEKTEVVEKVEKAEEVETNNDVEQIEQVSQENSTDEKN